MMLRLVIDVEILNSQTLLEAGRLAYKGQNKNVIDCEAAALKEVIEKSLQASGCDLLDWNDENVPEGTYL